MTDDEGFASPNVQAVQGDCPGGLDQGLKPTLVIK